jgi:ADP-heptose:LPS heptosyltransferase
VKALLVRLSSIGDVVHTLPTLDALSARGWETGWLVEPPSRSLLEGQKQLGEVALAPAARAFDWTAARRTLAGLRAARYDAALDLQGLWKSAAWSRLSGAARVIGYAPAWRRERPSAVLIRERVALPDTAVHVIDKNLALLRALGVEAVGHRRFPLPAAPEAEARVGRALGALGLGPFVVLNPGGGWASKRWPPDGFGAVAEGLRARGLAALVSWGPGEEGLADAVVQASGGAAVKGWATSLLEFVELARRASLVVAADTGPLHLACAVGTPVVALFGPTDPLRNGPFDAADQVVRRAPRCAPCYKRVCPVHEGVMRGIQPADVLAAVDRRREAVRAV